jgi:hypothetical protein
VAATVFSSILDAATRMNAAREMLGVLRPHGLILWYDFFVDNPWNPDVRGIGKREIYELFPKCRVRLERVTIAPPIGRRVAQTSRSLYSVLNSLKVFCTHYLGLIEKE